MRSTRARPTLGTAEEGLGLSLERYSTLQAAGWGGAG